MKSKQKAKLKIIELRRAINLVLQLGDKLELNDNEKELCGAAYLNLNPLRNSLHRYLVK